MREVRCDCPVSLESKNGSAYTKESFFLESEKAEFTYNKYLKVCGKMPFPSIIPLRDLDFQLDFYPLLLGLLYPKSAPPTPKSRPRLTPEGGVESRWSPVGTFVVRLSFSKFDACLKLQPLDCNERPVA